MFPGNAFVKLGTAFDAIMGLWFGRCLREKARDGVSVSRRHIPALAKQRNLLAKSEFVLFHFVF